jgi:hypothetical protein
MDYDAPGGSKSHAWRRPYEALDGDATHGKMCRRIMGKCTGLHSQEVSADGKPCQR